MHSLHHFLSEYGYWALAFLIGLESMGVPLPGETVLVMASMHAGHRGESIAPVIAAAVAGAIIGDNIGFYLGRELGFRFFVRFGRYLGITDSRIKLGQYLFMRHGAKVVFFGRFFAETAVPCRFPRRGQPAVMAALPCGERGRCGRVGDDFRSWCLRLRQAIHSCHRPALASSFRVGSSSGGGRVSLLVAPRSSVGGGG